MRALMPLQSAYMLQALYVLLGFVGSVEVMSDQSSGTCKAVVPLDQRETPDCHTPDPSVPLTSLTARSHSDI